MTAEKFNERYEKYSDQVKEYMMMFSNSLVEKYKEIPDVFVVSLDILAGNLDIMTKAMNTIASSANGIVGKDNYRGDKKSTELSAFLTSQNNVTKLVNAFGWTPMGKSKIRESQDSQDIAKYLESLTK